MQMLWEQYWDDIYVISKWASLFCKFFTNLSPFLCQFVTYNREYYQWLCRLRLHMQVGRLPVQGTWQGLVTQSDNEGPCNLHVKLIIIQWWLLRGEDIITWWRYLLPSSPRLALPHLNSSLETHFVLLPKINE